MYCPAIWLQLQIAFLLRSSNCLPSLAAVTAKCEQEVSALFVSNAEQVQNLISNYSTGMVDGSCYIIDHSSSPVFTMAFNMSGAMNVCASMTGWVELGVEPHLPWVSNKSAKRVVITCDVDLIQKQKDFVIFKSLANCSVTRSTC